MESLTFLNSPLLWGLGLASIPLIIHLLFRRKFLRIDWAPMHYLKLSIQKNRRRVRLEQLLLLLLRTAAILLLFAMVARPVLHASGLGAWLTGRSRASQILLIDDSLSMGYADGGRSSLDAAKELSAAVIRRIAAQDRFTLVLASRPAAPLLREVELANPDDAIKLLDGLRPVDSFVSWDSVFATVDELFSTSSYPLRELTVITDLRRSGWENDQSELGNRWAANRARMRFFDVGSAKTENISVAELELVDSVAMVNNPTSWTAAIHNGSANDLSGAEANFYVDGKPTLIRLPPIAPGETARVPLTATFQEPGWHHLSLQLAADALPGNALRGDDGLTSVVNVIDALRVTLVDGEPSTEPWGGETDYLALAFASGATDADAFRVEVIGDSQADWLSSSTAHAIVLANVATLKPAEAQRLMRLVESGVGLMIFGGEQIDPDNYNQLLANLLPGAIEGVEDQPSSGLVVADQSASPLAPLGQLSPAVLSRIKVRKFLRLRLPATLPPGVRVLANWNDPAGSPAAIERAVGLGRVLLWTTTADQGWTDWPKDPSYVLAMREATKALVYSDSRAHNLRAAEKLRRSVAATHSISKAEIETPEAERPQPLAIEVAAENETPAQTLVWADTRRAGLYKLHWQDAQAGPSDDLFAIYPDARESELQRIPAEDLQKLWGALAPEVISGSTSADAPLAVEGREIWRNLAVCLLGLMIGETCLATWAGRNH